jgi:hypothetical protein
MMDHFVEFDIDNQFLNSIVSMSFFLFDLI